INMQGTALDEVEELLLKNRHKPTSISARAVIRAGKGHRYWSAFNQEYSDKIESAAKKLHSILFDPDLNTPVKTLDLPLGGARGVRVAIQLLIDFILIANRDQQGNPKSLDKQDDDDSGLTTIQSLNNAIKLAEVITGNGDGSLGLHPAVYFYGPTGRHTSPMFLGTSALIAEKLKNNDRVFFKKFTNIRSRLESILVKDKELISLIIQKNSHRSRDVKYKEFLNDLIKRLEDEQDLSETELIQLAGLQGKIVAGDIASKAKKFTDDQKSMIFINTALQSAIKCPICNGYLDTTKSVSYDHIIRVREGGVGSYN
ncbi:hypothetical protein ACI0YI_004241, partial [Cronobacter sakazakii]